MKQSFADPIKVHSPKSHVPLPISALEKSVGECFAEVAEKFPDKLAVVDPDQEVTYRSLNQKANRLAHAIRTMKNPREVPITFILEKTADAIAAILGILKAGNIYVALDPSNPVDYLKIVLNDARPSLIITNTSHLLMVHKLSDQAIPILNIDELAPGLADTNPGEPPASTSLAAIFYTSGSTGNPKGVVLDHRALLHRSMVHINLHHISPEDRSPLPFSLSFAWSITPIFSTLLSGGTLYPCDYADMQLNDLVEWLNKNKITILHISSNLLRQILPSLSKEVRVFPYIRLVNAGSDVLYPQDVVTWKQVFQPNSILAYGLASTEMGTITRKFFNGKYKITGKSLPVGYPVPSVNIKIIDEGGKEVKLNEVGEIVVQSLSMIRGYWGEAGLEPLLFLQDKQNPASSKDVLLLDEKGQPFNRGEEDKTTARSRYLSSGYRKQPELSTKIVHTDPYDPTLPTYYSGDLGRWRADGALEFIGRRDTNVKIRGFSVQLEAIDYLLQKMDGIQDATCTEYQPSRGGKRIAAYLVPAGSQKPSVTDLREALSAQLPDYMVPSVFVWMEALPRTVTGKINRKDLPAPSGARPDLRSEFIAPRNAQEELIARIWCDLLQLESVGVQDNFFELGGNSLLALQLMTRIESDIGVKLPMQTLVSHPIIADLAGLIAELRPGAVHSSIVALRGEGKYPALFMVPGMARTSISLMNVASRLNPAYQIYGLEYPGMDGYLEPMDRIETLAEFFLQQIQTVQPHGPYHLAGFCLGGVIVFEIAQQLVGAGEEVGLLAILDSTPPATASGKRTQRTIGSSFYRALSLLFSGQFKLLWNKGKSRLHRTKALFFIWKRIQKLANKAPSKEWLNHNLDAQSRRVIEKLQAAKNLYTPSPYPGRGLVILSEVAQGTPRQQLWKQLLKDLECFYISETNHSNVFNDERSLDQIAELIDAHLPFINS